MRKPTACVPMITLCLLLCACGGGEKQTAQAVRAPYQEMKSAQMTAEVTAFYGDEVSAFTLPRLMSALRDGWLLEENEEDWGEDACMRLTLEQTGAQGGRIVSTLWLRQEDHVPVRGEISVDEKIILQAEFTDFQFGAILEDNGGAGE